MNTEQIIISRLSWITQTPPSRMHRHTHFKNDLHFDSIDTMMLIVDLESWFQVTLSTQEVETIETIHDACLCIDGHLSAMAA
ncbi:MAG: phosphopantetheine-binding protein [Bacteroidota bacterium]